QIKLHSSAPPPLPPKPVAYIYCSISAPTFFDVDEYWDSKCTMQQEHINN
ncbi:26274_t:CDS:2, partial [Gigaspora margarita]